MYTPNMFLGILLAGAFMLGYLFRAVNEHKRK